MRELVVEWRSRFDWRAQEARLNRFRQFKIALHGIELHFIHQPARSPRAMPLLISHGWPGSIVEFLELIPLLTEHFTVVAPSLPGYTLSFTPGQPRFGTEEIAECFAELIRLQRQAHRAGLGRRADRRRLDGPDGESGV